MTDYSLKDKEIRKVVSDDKSIATATFKGDTITVKGLKKGKTTIKVYGHQTSADITVTVK